MIRSFFHDLRTLHGDEYVRYHFLWTVKEVGEPSIFLHARLDHLRRYFDLIFLTRWPVGHLDTAFKYGTSTGYFPRVERGHLKGWLAKSVASKQDKPTGYEE